MTADAALPAEPAADRAAEHPADRVAEAVLATPGVAGLHGGRLGEVATLLPGRQVAGIRLRDDAWQVHLTVEWGTDVAEVGTAVRRSLAGLAGGRPVHVVVEDVAPAAVPGLPAGETDARA